MFAFGRKGDIGLRPSSSADRPNARSDRAFVADWPRRRGDRIVGGPDVRFWHEADIPMRTAHVRFWGYSVRGFRVVPKDNMKDFGNQLARGWIFPSLTDCRQSWSQRYGGKWTWHHNVKEWRVAE